MLTVKQAAEHLGVSSALIYALCAARKLRHERHGMKRGTIKIPDDALEEYRRSVTVQIREEAAPLPPPPRLQLKHLRL